MLQCPALTSEIPDSGGIWEETEEGFRKWGPWHEADFQEDGF